MEGLQLHCIYLWTEWLRKVYFIIWKLRPSSNRSVTLQIILRYEWHNIGLIEAFLSKLFKQTETTQEIGLICQISIAMYEIYNDQVLIIIHFVLPKKLGNGLV